MQNTSLIIYLLIAALIWFALLNFYLFKTARNFKRLTKDAAQGDLKSILESLINKSDLGEKRMNQLSQEMAKLENLNRQNFQKYAIIRFNPFEDTGGDQSFVAAFLDGQNNGVVLSSLHTRGGTRVYAKPVANGSAGEYQFSKEEKEVVERAVRKSPQNTNK